MSDQIETAMVQQYTTNIELLLQQKGSILKNSVTTANYKGKAAKAVEQIGLVLAEKIVSRHDNTPLTHTPHSARWVFPHDYIWADLIDDEDKLKMLIDPTSSYALNGSYALGRAMDDTIIEAFFNDAKIGENGAISKAFDLKNKVALAYSRNSQDSNQADVKTGLTLEKLQKAKSILRQNEIDFDHDPIYCAITAQQEQDLLSQTQVTSRDYNLNPVLVDGKLSQFMGINFIHIQRLTKDNKTNTRFCPMWSKSGIHLGIWQSPYVSIDKRADKRNSVQIMVKGSFGATRTDEKKVVKIECLEG